MIIRDRLDELLTYSQGKFFWKKRVGSGGRRRNGVRAGYQSNYGYWIICIDYKDYFEHNLCWFVEHGEWPPEGLEIDHIDRNKANNDPKNHRLCDRPQNNANQQIRSDNRSGQRGVYWDSRRGKWAVQLTIRGKTKSLGRYDDLCDAVIVSQKALITAWGEFYQNPHSGTPK